MFVAVFYCRAFSNNGGGRIEEQSKRKGNYTSITEYKWILWLSGHWRDKSPGIASWSGEWFYCEDREKAEQSLAKAMDSLESVLKKVADAQVQYEIWVNP